MESSEKFFVVLKPAIERERRRSDERRSLLEAYRRVDAEAFLWRNDLSLVVIHSESKDRSWLVECE